MLRSMVVISVGASCGAVVRWLLGSKLDAIFPLIPFGTLASNLIGGYLVGIAVAFFASQLSIAPEWRLLVITGFLGGLTTFSTFSAEVVSLLQEGRLAWALAEITLHVSGSLLMTSLGIVTLSLLRSS